MENPGDRIPEACAGDASAQKNFDSISDSQVDGTSTDANLLGFQHSESLSEEYSTAQKSSDSNEIENGDFDLINESGLEVAELDVESVLKKQNTHDLYCPNCNSCITRRVILRKRKRQVRTIGEDLKRNKSETAINSSFAHGDELATDNQICDTAEIYGDGTSEREKDLPSNPTLS